MSGLRQFADVLNSWTECEPLPGDSRATTSKPHRFKDRDRVRQRSLAEAIESEVIPRLMLAHRVSKSTEYQPTIRDLNPHVTAADVAEFSRLVLEHDSAVAQQFTQVLRARGVSAEALYLELLAPTARLLGEMWKADLCDFTDVTIGLSRLQQLLHEISPQFDSEAVEKRTDSRILLVPVPGEQHTLGIMLVEEFFRREGWDCCSAMLKTDQDLIRRVKTERFDVVGLSVSCVVWLERLAALIQAVKAASLNRNVLIMVGGPVFLDRPDFAQLVGADATAVDGRQAVLQLRSLSDRAV